MAARFLRSLKQVFQVQIMPLAAPDFNQLSQPIAAIESTIGSAFSQRRGQAATPK